MQTLTVQLILSPLVVIALLAIFAFSFRESTKTAQSWGAFAGEGLSKLAFLIKLGVSLPLITFIPLADIVLFWRGKSCLPDPGMSLLLSLWSFL